MMDQVLDSRSASELESVVLARWRRGAFRSEWYSALDLQRYVETAPTKLVYRFPEDSVALVSEIQTNAGLAVSVFSGVLHECEQVRIRHVAV